MMVSNFVLLSSYSEICYTITRFHLLIIDTQSELTPLNVHMTGIPIVDSPQKENQSHGASKANDGK